MNSITNQGDGSAVQPAGTELPRRTADEALSDQGEVAFGVKALPRSTPSLALDAVLELTTQPWNR